MRGDKKFMFFDYKMSCSGLIMRQKILDQIVFSKINFLLVIGSFLKNRRADKKRMKLLSFFLISLLFSIWSYASVDVRNGNFFFSFVDGEFSSEDNFWQIQRSYNSRSNRVGLFGWGWCTPLETKLEIVSTDELRIQNCGSGSITKFILKSVGRWVNGNEELVSEKQDYILKVNGVSQLQFDSEGKLAKFWIGMTKASVGYVKNKLRSVTIDRKVINFELNDESYVVKVSFPDGTSSKFQYEDLNLVNVENAWGGKYEYKYDANHNLRNASWPDKTNVEITYDTTKDWVKSFKYRNGCFEKYKFQSVRNGAGGEKLETSVDMKCPRFPASVVTKYELIWDSKKTLTLASRSRNGVLESAKMDEKTGKMKEYNDGNFIVTYKYNEKGELISKDSKDTKVRYVRAPSGQIQEIKWPDRSLKIQSDSRGRVSSLSLGGKKNIRIIYMGDSEKIKTIESNLGSVTYEYDRKGLQTNEIYSSSQISELRRLVNEVYGSFVFATDESTSFKGFAE